MTSVRKAKRRLSRWDRYVRRYRYWNSEGQIRAEILYVFAAERVANRRGETRFCEVLSPSA